MGAKVDYTKNFIRYSRKETKSITISAANTKYELFEATSDCLIKISHATYGGGGGLRYYVNNETTNFATSESDGRFSPNKANKYSLTPAVGNNGPYEYEMVILLQKGDKIKVSADTVFSTASLTYTILIYE